MVVEVMVAERVTWEMVMKVVVTMQMEWVVIRVVERVTRV